jgi:hypothetical protein
MKNLYKKNGMFGQDLFNLSSKNSNILSFKLKIHNILSYHCVDFNLWQSIYNAFFFLKSMGGVLHHMAKNYEKKSNFFL